MLQHAKNEILKTANN